MSNQDYRSPLAKARDEWLDSKADDIRAWSAEAHDIDVKYIRNRLDEAFEAGADAAKRIAVTQD